MARYECPRCGQVLETLRGVDHHMRDCRIPTEKRQILMEKFDAFSDKRHILKAEDFVTKSNYKVMAEGHCQVCASMSARVDLHHIIRESDGGSNDISNLVVLCKRCHDMAEVARQTKNGRLGGVPKRLEKYTIDALHNAQLNYVSPRGERRRSPYYYY